MNVSFEVRGDPIKRIKGGGHRHHPPLPPPSTPRRPSRLSPGRPHPPAPTTPDAPEPEHPNYAAQRAPSTTVDTSYISCWARCRLRPGRASSKAASSVPIRRVCTELRSASGLGGRGFGVTRPDHGRGLRLVARNGTSVDPRVTQKRKKSSSFDASRAPPFPRGEHSRTWGPSGVAGASTERPTPQPHLGCILAGVGRTGFLAGGGKTNQWLAARGPAKNRPLRTPLRRDHGARRPAEPAWATALTHWEGGGRLSTTGAARLGGRLPQPLPAASTPP